MQTVRQTLRAAIALALVLGALVGVARAATAFPVKPAADKRTLVDQNGVAFPILGRTAWFITSLAASDQQVFLADTLNRGFNAIEFHVLNHDARGNNPPFDANGQAPFLKRLDGADWNGALTYANINTEAPDFTTPNPAYWAGVDNLLASCESQGILVFMFPAYVGYNGQEQGWMQELVANGPAKMQTYGAWLATRYKNRKSLVWMLGGDMGTPPHAFNSAQTAAENGLLNGLKSVTGQQSVQFSAEWDSGSLAADQTTFGSAVTLNGVYSWTGDVNFHGRRAYARSPVLPAFLLEQPYDEEGPDGNGVNPSATQPVRRFIWWGWLSTIGGYVTGNGYVWPFRSGGDGDWRNHLDSTGARDLARLNAFIRSQAWNKLVPSGLNGMRTLITAGGGASPSAADYVAASAAVDGKLLVAYIPPAHAGPITVDMGAMSGLARARWFDPTSGDYSSIGSGFTNAGPREFLPPGANNSGYTDWVLVLDVPDSTKPSLKITTPTSAAAFTNTTGAINLAGTAADNSAVTQVTWKNDRGGAGVANGTTSWSVPGLVLAPGLNQLTVTAKDPSGNATEAALAVLYRVPPFFLQQPSSSLAATNDTLTLNVEVGGDEPFKFQWRKNGSNITGATNRWLTLTNVTPAAAGSYSIFVSNPAGSRTSSNAVLKVFVPPKFTVQPASASVTVGRSVSFSVRASGTAPLFYQWWFDGAPITGATGTTFTILRTATNQAGLYRVTVSNYAGLRSSTNAELRVNVPPRLTVQPQSQPAVVGPTNVTFHAEATGTEPLRFQWRRNGANIAGATNASYTLTTITNTSGGNFTVYVANVAGSAVSSNAVLKVFLPPVLTRQPVSRTVTTGGSVTFSASASGTAPLFYQWRHDDVPLLGATNASYLIKSVTNISAGNYSVVVKNFAGSQTSSNALLTVPTPVQVVAKAAIELPPTLTIAVDGDKVFISWPLTTTRYLLQSSTDLRHWQTLPPASTIDGTCLVVEPLGAPARFYQLFGSGELPAAP